MASLLRNDERVVMGAVAELVDCNPFLPERVELERRALGDAFVHAGTVWHADGDIAAFNPNAVRLREVVERLGAALRGRLAEGVKATPGELADYHRLVLYVLFQRYEDDWYALIEPIDPTAGRHKRVVWYERFARDAVNFFPGTQTPPADLAHFFALGFQARRAFHHIFRQIFGGSLPAARLRASVWQSIFTHDMRRYRTALSDRMADITTLITGESGTGKELVARAIALSQHIPFDAQTQSFAADPAAGFCAVNLSALSPTLIESELFGHRRGAFTGAAADRSGWLETCGRHGVVFLDEIGELDPAIQIKLLRVLQTRVFERIGETTPRRFEGKVIAATNRDLEEEISARRFRDDLYYRICADLISAPTLHEQLADAPDDLHNLIFIVARRVAGTEEAERLASEVEGWVLTHLGRDYPWPGNMRELEQCVRNILIRAEYRPRRPSRDGAGELAEALRQGHLTADELLQEYCTLVHGQTGSYQETARRLGVDRRTVRAKVIAWTRRHRDAKQG